MKIKSVTRRTLQEPTPVYDLTSMKHHNFALSNGVVVHNSAQKARNPEVHELLPLRGKPLNVYTDTKGTKTFAVKSEVMNILKSIGYDPSKKDPLSALRVGKIVLLADEDLDGCWGSKTRVLTLDGKNPTFEKLVKVWGKNPTPFWVYSRNSKGGLIPALATNPRPTTVVTKKAYVELDNGHVFECTVDHKFLINSAEDFFDSKVTWYKGNPYVEAKDLKSGNSLNSVYFRNSTADGMPLRNDCLQLIAESKFRGKLTKEDGYVLNHKVVSVKLVDCKPTQMYCLTVEKTGNFMVDDGFGNGVGSSNCHINVLLFSIFQKLLPQLVAMGKVFVVDGSLFIGEAGKTKYYASSLSELKQKAGRKLDTVTRLKGLGECPATVLRDMCFSPDSKLIKLEPLTPEQNKDFTALMSRGKESSEVKRNLLGIGVDGDGSNEEE